MKTYVDLVQFGSLESGDDHFPSAGLPNGDQGNGGDAVLEDGRERSGDGHAFK